MKNKAFIVLVLLILMGCKTAQPIAKKLNNINSVYPTISYLEIKLDTFRRLPSNPYIVTVFSPFFYKKK